MTFCEQYCSIFYWHRKTLRITHAPRPLRAVTFSLAWQGRWVSFRLEDWRKSNSCSSFALNPALHHARIAWNNFKPISLLRDREKGDKCSLKFGHISKVCATKIEAKFFKFAVCSLVFFSILNQPCSFFVYVYLFSVFQSWSKLLF